LRIITSQFTITEINDMLNRENLIVNKTYQRSPHIWDLGHADLATTNRYLATTAAGLRGAAKQFKSVRTAFAPDLYEHADQPVPADQTSRIEVSEKSVS
jgi:hypothetical protein